MKTRIWFLSLALVLTACTPPSTLATPTLQPTASPLPATRSPIATAATSPEDEGSHQVAEVPAESNFSLGVRITTQLTPQQIAFVNQHYQVVMTSILSQAAREAIQKPQLILYRSIQGTWTGFEQFDWAYIDAHENMFAHHAGKRILTRWDSWLMAAGDMAPAGAADEREHWINYYALTAAEQVHQYGYDGLFIDSASHWLNPSAVYGQMPDDYEAEAWYQARVAALAYIKSCLPDKVVVFNGLHNGHGAEDSLSNTDGGMWETFAFWPRSGEYQGEAYWEKALSLVTRHPDKAIVLVVKEQPGLQEDIQKRLFVAGSYLLVSRPNLYFSMTDLAHAEREGLLYYPEYTLDLGAPLEAYTRSEAGLYLRRFERGVVLVNPSERETITYTLEGEYRQVTPAGGGEVNAAGEWQGQLRYEPVTRQVSVPPVGALILVRP